MIYAVRCLDRIKIGYSKTPVLRFSKIETDTPFPCELLCIREGGRLEEAELHARFAPYRAHREWFYAVDEIVQHFSGPLNLKPAPRPANSAPAEGEGFSPDSEAGKFRAVVEQHIARHEMTPTEFGSRFAGDPRFVHELRKGREPRTGTRQRILDAMQTPQAAE